MFVDESQIFFKKTFIWGKKLFWGYCRNLMHLQNIWFQLSWIGLNLTLILVVRYFTGKFKCICWYFKIFVNKSTKLSVCSGICFCFTMFFVEITSEIVMWHQSYGPVVLCRRVSVLYPWMEVSEQSAKAKVFGKFLFEKDMKIAVFVSTPTVF